MNEREIGVNNPVAFKSGDMFRLLDIPESLEKDRLWAAWLGGIDVSSTMVPGKIGNPKLSGRGIVENILFKFGAGSMAGGTNTVDLKTHRLEAI